MIDTTDHAPTDSMTVLAIYLGIVQFFLLLTWTVYAIYLPALLESVGVEKHWAGWVLLADQMLFACFDIAAGFLADRAFRLYARIGYTVIAVTTVSCIAFVALPLLPGLGAGPKMLLGIIVVWVVSSSALRSPLFGLLARHAAKPALPQLAGWALAGMGLAAALSPYLGTLLKGQDPRLPFLVSSLSLLLVVAGVVLAERRGTAATAPTAPSPDRPIPSWGWLAAVLLAAFAVQIAVFINAGPRYLHDADPTWMPWLMPVFWVAFSLIVFVAGRLSKQWGAPRLFLIGCLAGATGLALTSLPGIAAAVGGYALAGLGWGAALPSAFAMAADSGRPGRAATYTGMLFATLAGGAFLRIGINLSGWPKQPELASLLSAVPSLAWLLSGLLIVIAIYLSLDRGQPKSSSGQ